MVKLLKYSMMPTIKNSINNDCLVKAMCEFCGRKFGSIEEARKCEFKHINRLIRGEFHKED